MVARLISALTLCLLLSLPHRGQAQTSVLTWQNAYGTSRDETEGFSVPMNGGYLLAGERSYFNGTGALLYFVQTNALGDTLWTKTLTAPVAVNPHITGFVRDASGNLLLTGVQYSGNVGFVMKLTSACVPVWNRVRQLVPPSGGSPSTAYLYPVVDTDNNYLMVESLHYSTSSGSVNDEAILKLNQFSGAEIWNTNLLGFYQSRFNDRVSAPKSQALCSNWQR